MTSQTGEQTIAIHILSNISRSKGNQAMKFDYLIAAPQGGVIALHVWEKVCEKNLKIFKGCHYSRFYITVFLCFWEIETNNLNSDQRILIFLVLGTNHQLQLSKH